MSGGYLASSDGLTYTYTTAKDSVKLAELKGFITTATSGVEIETVTTDETGLTGTITITNKEALKAANSTLTLSNGGAYTLAFNDESLADPDDFSAKAEIGYWVVSGTKATYKQKTTAGWTTDGKTITYTAPTDKALATVSGLLKGFADNGTYTWDENEKAFVNEDGTKLEGIDISTAGTTKTTGTITLDKRALGTSKVTVGAKENFSLAIDTTSGNKVDGKLSAETNCWVVSGTTATYKKALPAYYEAASDGKSITYTATSKGTTLATVKGLAKNLIVGTNATDTGNKINEVYAVVDDDEGGTTNQVVMTVTEPSGNNSGVITLYDGAQATSNITVGATENYTLKLNKEADKNGYGGVISAAHIEDTDNATWKVSKGTATLNGVLIGGFSESSDNKTLIYTAGSIVKNGNYVAKDIVQLKGLDKIVVPDDDYSGIGGLED